MLIQAAGSQAPRQQAQAEGLTLRVAENTTVAAGAAAKGGANHIRSSLMMVLEDTATVSTAGVGSSGPPEDREAGCRVYPGSRARSHEGG